MGKIIEAKIRNIVEDILEDYQKERAIDKIDIFRQPDKQEIIKVINGLLQIVYPGYYFDKTYKIYSIDHKLSVKVEDTIYPQHFLAVSLLCGKCWKRMYRRPFGETQRQNAKKRSSCHIRACMRSQYTAWPTNYFFWMCL